tara:strand:- start:1119 stop:1826 length:708 start_codon:yes stop_codon:yes gene_type:complete
MKLYHGTSERVGRIALTEGLKPRSESSAESNWEGTVPSNPEVVYLTSSYPGHFAAHVSGLKERWAIVEVDTDLLDEWCLHPDEDSLEQGTRGVETGYPEVDEMPLGAMRARTMWFRDNIELFQPLWPRSLELLGTVCYYGAIPPEAITRVSFYDPKSSGGVTMAAMDSMVSLINHKILAERHGKLVSVLMGDSADPGALLIHPGIGALMGKDYLQGVRAELERVEVEVLINNGEE